MFSMNGNKKLRRSLSFNGGSQACPIRVKF